jgi:ABC-type glycerol-3-phosphate transport system permease component
MKKRINWTKGLTRIYLLLVFVWALYCIYWVPMEQVESWQTLASLTQDETKRSEYLSHANLVAQWKELGKEFISSPIIVSAALLLPPILGYGLLRLTIFITRWVFKGFQHDN